MLLTQHDKGASMLVSALFIVSITTFVDILTEGMTIADSAVLICALWTSGYFIILTAHIAMWTHLYQMNVKAPGYHMARAL